MLVKGSFLRRKGSFGGRSKITQTLTSTSFVGQSACLIEARRVSREIVNPDENLGEPWLKSTDH